MVRGAPHFCSNDQFYGDVSAGRREVAHNIKVLGAAGLEQDETHVWVLDESSDDDQVTALAFWLLIALGTCFAATEEPAIISIAFLLLQFPVDSPAIVNSKVAEIE